MLLQRLWTSGSFQLQIGSNDLCSLQSCCMKYKQLVSGGNEERDSSQWVRTSAEWSGSLDKVVVIVSCPGTFTPSQASPAQARPGQKQHSKGLSSVVAIIMKFKCTSCTLSLSSLSSYEINIETDCFNSKIRLIIPEGFLFLLKIKGMFFIIGLLYYLRLHPIVYDCISLDMIIHIIINWWILRIMLIRGYFLYIRVDLFLEMYQYLRCSHSDIFLFSW